MANVIVTSTTNSILIDFGAYYPAIINTRKIALTKAHIIFSYRSNFVELHIEPNDLAISFEGGENTMKVDSINGVAPTSNSDLYDKLIALIA